jgi:hypothetical protein
MMNISLTFSSEQIPPCRHPREGGDPPSTTTYVAPKLDSMSRLRCRSGLHGMTIVGVEEANS